MLSRQKRGRHETATWFPLIAMTKAARSATRSFRSDIAADQRSIGRPWRDLRDIGDGALLVLGLGIGEAGARIRRRARPESRWPASLSCARRRDADQLSAISRTRAFMRALRCCQPARQRSSCTPALPSRARQQLDVLDGQEQLAASYCSSRQSWGGLDLDGLEPEIAPDAMFDVGDRFARGERGGFGEEVLRAARAAARGTMRSPRMSWSVMTAKSGASKPCSMPSTASPTAPFVHRGGFAPVGDALDDPDGDRQHAAMRSAEPSLQQPMTMRFPAFCNWATWAAAASKMLTRATASSSRLLRALGAKSRPGLPRIGRMGRIRCCER